MMLRSISCLAFGFLVSVGICRANDLFEIRQFETPDTNQKLPYRLLRPAMAEEGKKYPLVIFLHGAGERGSDNIAQLRHGVSRFTNPAERAAFPCYVFVPQCPSDQRWASVDWTKNPVEIGANAAPIQQLVLDAVDRLTTEFPIDLDRVYLTGISMGGIGTWDIAARNPSRFAAIVPVCGGIEPTRAADIAIPAWVFHGSADRVVPPSWSRDAVVAMQRASRTVYYTEYPDVGHDSWTAAYSEPFLLKWLFAQKRGTPTAPGTPAPAASLDLDEMPVPAAFPEVGQLQTADWFKRLWKQRRSAWRQSTAADRGKIVFLGDSITQGWESALAKDFPSLAIANRGISGDTSRGVRLRLDRDVIALDPAAVSLLIGTNDLALGGTPEQVATHIRAIVRNLRKAKPNLPIILNLVMPRGVAPGLFPEKIRDLNDSIRKLAADEKTSLCDSWTPFDDGTGSCRREEFPDMLHPNEAGYAKWKGALQPILDSFGVSGKP